MNTSYQVIAILILAALIAATPSPYPSALATVIVTIRKTASILVKTTPATASAPDIKIAAVPVTITFKETVLVLHLKKSGTTSAIVTGSNTIPPVPFAMEHTIAAPTTKVPKTSRTVTDGGEHMTIAITNVFSKPLSPSFASNAGGPSPVGNPTATTLSHDALT